MTQLIEFEQVFEGTIRSFSFIKKVSEPNCVMTVHVKLELSESVLQMFQLRINPDSSRFITGKFKSCFQD